MTTSTKAVQEQFFEIVFSGGEGYICIASRKAMNVGPFIEEYFWWPDKRSNMYRYIDQQSVGRNVWFCPHFLSHKKREKYNVTHTNVVWADLDACDPDDIDLPVPIVVMSSPGRYQAYWTLTEQVHPLVAEDYSKRVAYYLRDKGADVSGWDLSQLLRVPGTYNYKYTTNIERPPEVRLLRGINKPVPTELFEALPTVADSFFVAQPKPQATPEADAVIANNKHALTAEWWNLYVTEPRADDDWSRILWRFMMTCFECELSKEETFAVSGQAACNKWARDRKPDVYLWNDVLRCSKAFEDTERAIGSTAVEVPVLVRENEEWTDNSFADEYIAWARVQSDAAAEYHEAVAFVILSALLSGSISLPTGFGRISPNIWVMLIADTTLTRKTTAMNMGMDLLHEISPDVILATDGSIEGILQELSLRPGVPSVFLRDEFTGLIDAVQRKDYLSGTLETFTKLYDGKNEKRVLKKEVVTVTNPVFIILAGGTRKRLLQILSEDHVLSGFLPRFIFVSAESDVSKLRPVGPPTPESVDQRNKLLATLAKLRDLYVTKREVKLPGTGTVVEEQVKFTAELTTDAWKRYNELERTLVDYGYNSDAPETHTPMLDRLSKTCLKLSVLIAACRQSPTAERTIKVIEADVVAAARFIQTWFKFTLEVLTNIGKSKNEHLLEKFIEKVKKDPGTTRAQIMRYLKTASWEMDNLQETAEQRGLILVHRKEKQRGVWYSAT
ncbi:MAG TPA: DUF3987 domain-containing protein [Candidatus Saccharimonadales bacterium]|nr:DUF3987 domain-containing protein [Candidatus Saccharimonadales bacterium]